MKNLKITPPKGYEIDTEKSTFEDIVFKPVNKELPKSWEELKSVKGWWVTKQANLNTASSNAEKGNENIFAIEAQARASIALAQLSQLREVYRAGWQPDWSGIKKKYVIERVENKITTENCYSYFNYFLSFQSEEIRDEFLKNFKDLIEEASPLLFG